MRLLSRTDVSAPRPDEPDPFTTDEADVGFLCSPGYFWLSDREPPAVLLVPAAFLFDDPRCAGRPVYFADLGLILGPRGPGPGPRTGSVRRIRFEHGEPLPPETLLDGLSFPDGVGVFDP